MQSGPGEFPLSERMTRIDTSRIRRMFDLAAKLDNPINLSIGQPHFPTPAPIIEEISRAMRDGKTAYTQTQGILPLRERLARKYSEVNGFETDPDRIVVSAGVAGLIQLLFMVLVNPGDRVLLIEPYFLTYRSLLDFFGATVETIPETFTAADVERIEPAGLRLVMFSSPSNPTGHVVGEAQLRLLAELADRSGALLVSDEIYELFDYDNRFRSAASIYPRTVTLTGFSKSYSMTGLRLSAATGPAEVMKALTTLQQYTVVCAPAPVQWGGICALDLNLTSYVDAYRKNRDRVVAALSGLATFTHPAGAFYVFPSIRQDGGRFAQRAVEEKKLIVVPGDIFTSDPNHIRISYAVEPATLDAGLTALRELLAG